MDYGFLRVGIAIPELCMGNCTKNTDEIIMLIKKAEKLGIECLVFPELTITSCDCTSSFLYSVFLEQAQKELLRLVQETKNSPVFFIVGLPLSILNTVYNVAVSMYRGKILAIVPKQSTDYPFALPQNIPETFSLSNEYQDIPFGTDLQLCLKTADAITVRLAIELSYDILLPSLVKQDVDLICNTAAIPETLATEAQLKTLIKAETLRYNVDYLFANEGNFSSAKDNVYMGSGFIAENGFILDNEQLSVNNSKLKYLDIDIQMLHHKKRVAQRSMQTARIIMVQFNKQVSQNFCKIINPLPFLPDFKHSKTSLFNFAQKTLELLTIALVAKLKNTGIQYLYLGLSGGLDSTLALLIAIRACDTLGYPRTNIKTVSMPCFGTSTRTKGNSSALARACEVDFSEISIKKAVEQHLQDISHDKTIDSTYENAQARERTQVLLDLANKTGGLVLGTGDLSESALGWTTYNGDHMSHYGLNSSVPKTLIRIIMAFVIQTTNNSNLATVLQDILATPISPELLPEKNGIISQKTEDLVGPYVLHDFFLYHHLQNGFSPKKIYFLATQAFCVQKIDTEISQFCGQYTKKEILKWLRVFYKRFFSQQFKRACSPEGPCVGDISFSKKSQWIVPADFSGTEWIKQLDDIQDV